MLGYGPSKTYESSNNNLYRMLSVEYINPNLDTIYDLSNSGYGGGSVYG